MGDEKHDEREEAAEDGAEDLEVSDEAAEDVQGGLRFRKAGGDPGIDAGRMR